MSILLDYLQRLKARDDRGALADLRCALVESRKYRAWPLLASFDGIGEAHPAKVIQTIAGMFAFHPVITITGNMGDTCLALMSEDERREYLQERKIGPMTRRFQHLLAANRDEICARVVRIALYAKSKDVAVNYVRLEKDLTYWSDNVRIEWAKSFWQAKEKEGDTL